MLWSVGFAVLLLVVVGLRYLRPGRPCCPQCGAPQEADAPLCTACGWIFAAPEDDDDEWGDPADDVTAPGA